MVMHTYSKVRRMVDNSSRCFMALHKKAIKCRAATDGPDFRGILLHTSWAVQSLPAHQTTHAIYSEAMFHPLYRAFWVASSPLCLEFTSRFLTRVRLHLEIEQPTEAMTVLGPETSRFELFLTNIEEVQGKRVILSQAQYPLFPCVR